MRFLVLSLLLGFSPCLPAQTVSCDCAADIEWLHEKIKKTPAYKRNKANYQVALQTALRQAETELTTYECYEAINRLLIPLEDWHLGVYGPAPDSPDAPAVDYPNVGAELDELVVDLEQQPAAAIEGIYRSPNGLTLGIKYREEKELYEGIVLATESPDWKKGDVLYQYLPLTEEVLLATGAQFPRRRLISYREKISDGLMLTLGLQKDTTVTVYRKPPDEDETYVYRSLSPSIDYLKVGSFTGQYPLLAEAEAFYTSLDGKLTKAHLVLDLRGNGGGGNRNSNLLLKHLKRYLKTGKLYVLANFSTGSNAEQFVAKLQQHKRVVFLGDNTKGALAYEIKPGDYHTLPSTNFSVILTSKLHNEFLPFETAGVTPNHFLDYRESWIAQVEAFIQREQ